MFSIKISSLTFSNYFKTGRFPCFLLPKDNILNSDSGFEQVWPQLKWKISSCKPNPHCLSLTVRLLALDLLLTLPLGHTCHCLARPHPSNRGKTNQAHLMFFLEETQHSVKLIDRNTEYNNSLSVRFQWSKICYSMHKTQTFRSYLI